MPISQYSLLSQQNEGNVRLFFFATMVTFLLPVILIVAGAQEPNKFVIYGFGIVAVVFFVLGVVWPPIRRFLEFRRYSVPMIPSGLAWFILIISMAGYTLFSGINSSIQISRLPVAAENYQGTPLGIWWMTARLVATTPPLVFGFAVDAKNVGTEELALKDAYLISGIDSTKVSMLVSTPPMEAIPVTEASIPPNAPIAFTAPFNNTSEQEFFKKWSTFTMIIQYNDNSQKPIRHEFNRLWVLEQVNQNHPESLPHVSRRQF